MVIKDITERKRFQKAVEDERNNLRSVRDANPAALLEFGPDEKLVQSNPAAQKLFSALDPDKGLRCGDCINCIHRKDVPEGCGRGPNCSSCLLNINIKKLLAEGGEAKDIELSLDCESEGGVATRWFIAGMATLEQDGARHVLVSLLDITERRHMEQKLAKSEEMFRLLAENSSDIIYRYEILPQRRFRYVSPAAQRIVGYSPQEHYDDPDLGDKIIHPQDRHLLVKIASGEIDPNQPLELRWIAKDGRTVWVEQRNRHIYDQEGKLAAIEGVARDITQRRQAEEALGFQRHLSEIMAHASPSIVVSLGPESIILSYNTYAEKLTGYQASEVLGKRWIDFFIPEGRRQELLDLWKDIVEKGFIEHHYVNPILTKDGGERIISWSNTVVKKEGKFEMVLSIGEDVTDRVQAEQKIKRQFEEINAMYQAMLGREDRVRELKEEVNEILRRQGLPPKYIVK